MDCINPGAYRGTELCTRGHAGMDDASQGKD